MFSINYGKTCIWSDEVFINDWISCGTKASSRRLSKMSASSATRGWNNKDLLPNVWGIGEGNGISGNTVNKLKFYVSIKQFSSNLRYIY